HAGWNLQQRSRRGRAASLAQSLTFIALGAAPAYPSVWGSEKASPRSSDWGSAVTPIVVSIPWRPRMSQEIRADVAASALERTELGNATTDKESWEELLPHGLPRGCAVASERRGSTRAKAAAPDESRPPEEGARRAPQARREPRVRDALLRRRRVLRGRGQRCRAVARPGLGVGLVDGHDH